MGRGLRLLSLGCLLVCSAVTAGEAVLHDEIADARVASTPAQIETSLDVLERLFGGGNYPQARQLCDELLNNPYFGPIPPVVRDKVDYATLTQEFISTLESQYAFLNNARAVRQLKREMVRLYHARTWYEQAATTNDRAMMRDAIAEFQRLASNQYLFSAQQYQAEAAYRAGQGYVWLGEYSPAASVLRRVSSLNPNPELEVRACLLLADALKAMADQIGTRSDARPARSPQDVPADPREELKTREGLLREAERELSKIAVNHPQSRQNPETELRLIELRFELQEYDEAERLASELLKRANPGSEDYAKASYYRANAVYLEGRIAEAAEFFRVALDENKNASAAVRADLLYGYGWTNSRLADAASPEQRQVFLTRAQAALRQAVKLLPFGTRRQDAQMDLAAALIQMRQFRDALEFLQEVIAEPRLRAKANYLAGQAAQGEGDTAAATRYFDAALGQARREGGGRLALEALQHLAELENEGGNYAEACEYYRLAQTAAVEQREFDVVATSSLGMAVAAAELAGAGAEDRQKAAVRLAEAILAAGVTPGDAQDAAAAAQRVAFRLSALQQWTEAGPGDLDTAQEILKKLQGRLLPRLREDELMYVQGKVYYLSAQSRLKNLPMISNSAVSQYGPVFKSFADAEAVLNGSLNANPRGSVSPRTRYLLGQVYIGCANLKTDLASFLRGKGMGAEAVQLEQEGMQYYQKAVGPLSLAVLDSDNDVPLRIDARMLLGQTYLALGKYGEDPAQYEKGLDEFRLLLSEVSISPARRLTVLRDMATALAQKKRKQEAVDLLMPQVGEDILCALQAAQILQDLKQPRNAYETLDRGVAAAGKREGGKSVDLARALYTLRKMGLSQADEIVRDPAQAKMLQAASGEGLLALSEQYPGTEWASRALLDLGQWLLGQGKWLEAYERAEAGIAKLKGNTRAADTVQAMYLLAGRAQLQGGLAEASQDLLRQANENFQKAERADTQTPLGREQRAASIREQGNVSLALGNKQDALRFYGRVFSIFYNEYRQADLARIAAAKIHADAGNYDLALKILDAGFDQEVLLQYKLLYRQKAGRTE